VCGGGEGGGRQGSGYSGLQLTEGLMNFRRSQCIPVYMDMPTWTFSCVGGCEGASAHMDWFMVSLWMLKS
jgi:hypothetical protein